MYPAFLKQLPNIVKSTYALHKEFVNINIFFMVLLIVFFSPTILFHRYSSGADVLSFWPLFSQEISSTVQHSVFSDVVSSNVQNSVFSDVVTQFDPWLFYGHNNIGNLSYLLWNPYGGCGVPLIANMQSAFFYPLNWPIILMGLTPLTLLFLYGGKIYLTGIFTYYYLRTIKLGTMASTMGAIGFMFGGYMMMWLYWPLSSPLFILPALLLLIEKMFSEPNIKYFIGISVITAIGAVSGHPETYFHIGIISVSYFIYRWVTSKIKFRENLHIAVKYLLFSFIGLGLSVIQLLPFAEYMLNSYVLSFRGGVKYYLPWQASITNFIPEFYGSHSVNLLPYYFNNTGLNCPETLGGYVGITILMFAVYAVLRNYKLDIVKFYCVTGIIALSVIYHISPIFEIMTALPPMSVSANHRLLFFVGFSFAILGSIGFDKLLTEIKNDRWKNELKWIGLSVFTMLVFLISLVYFNRINPESYTNFKTAMLVQNIEIMITFFLVIMTIIILMIIASHKTKSVSNLMIMVLVFLVFIETGIHGMLYEPTIDGKSYYPKIVAFDRVTSGEELSRTTAIDIVNDQLGIFPVNTQMIYGVYEIRDYDAIEEKYYWNLFNSLTKHSNGWVTLNDIDQRFLNFLGVKWVFTSSPYNGKSNYTFKDMFGIGNVYLYENRDALPRAFISHNVTSSTNDSEILNTLKNPDFPWGYSIILSGQNLNLLNQPGSITNDSVEIKKYTPDYIQITSINNQAGYLILTDTYYPGWNAYVNGEKVDIYRANYAFRSIKLNPGQNFVEFKYEPMSVYLGSIISIISLMVLIFLYLRNIRLVG